MCSEPKMLRVYTVPHITRMADVDSFGNFSYVNFIRVSMSACSFSVYSERPISTRVERPFPKPTGLGLVDFLKEALLVRHVFRHATILSGRHQ
jgi:hypothetical protein